VGLMKAIIQARFGLGMIWCDTLRIIWGWGLHKARINAPSLGRNT